MNVVVMGAGAGAAATVAELVTAGHDVALWNRTAATLAPFQAAGGIIFGGVLGEGLARPRLMTCDLPAASEGAEAAIVALPTHAQAGVAKLLAESGWPSESPVILNPGHTGGALEFQHSYRNAGADCPPVAEFSTLTYVARKLTLDSVSVTGRAKCVRVACLPGGETALKVACRLFPGAEPVRDVLATGLANVNMVLHPPGAVLAAAWVEATGGDFTFYVEAMTPGVERVMRRLDGERLAVAAAFGHKLPNLIEEMRCIGTVEEGIADTSDYAAAIAGGEANRRIKAPDSLQHRYYREDFGHGLLPFMELATIAGIETPIARALFEIAEAALGADLRAAGRTGQAMGIAGLTKDELLARVRGT